MKASSQLYTGPRASMNTVATQQPEEGPGGGFKLSGSFKPANAKKAEQPSSARSPDKVPSSSLKR